MIASWHESMTRVLPPGAYLLRATAWDRASNQNSTDRRIDGEPMVITLPLRVVSVLRVGVRAERIVRRSIKRGGKRRTVRKRIVDLKPRAEVRYGERVTVAGRLENGDGQPVPGVEIQVFSGSATDRGQLIGAVTTDAAGRFTYRALADATRTLRFAYSGTPVMLPVESQVNLLTSAASTIRATPRRLTNGQSVRFSGKLRALPAPGCGQIDRAAGCSLGSLANVPHDADPSERVVGDPLPLPANVRPAPLPVPGQASSGVRLCISDRIHQSGEGDGPRASVPMTLDRDKSALQPAPERVIAMMEAGEEVV